MGENGNSLEAQIRALQQKSMAELRAMARERGLRGDTKAELIKLLTGVSQLPKSLLASAALPPAPHMNGTSSYAAAKLKGPYTPDSNVLDQIRSLQSKTMLDLRTMARQKGLRGDTKSELIKALLGIASLPSSSRTSRAVSPTSRTGGSPNVRSGGLGGSAASTGKEAGLDPRRKALEALSMGELRRLAREKGLRGDTKKEIIALLLKIT